MISSYDCIILYNIFVLFQILQSFISINNTVTITFV